jgi:phenylacetate-CoA ligase
MAVLKNILKQTMVKFPRIEKTASRLMSSIPLTIRLGKDFWTWYSFFGESEDWSLDQITEYQMSYLHKLLDELSETSEFYRKRFSGLNVHQLTTIDEFRKRIPTLSRSEFRENYSGIRSSKWKQMRLVEARTSGTTGMALQFFHPAKDRMREWAAICHQWRRVGYRPGKSRRAEFRGLTNPDKIVSVFPEMNMIRCSVLHLKHQHVCHYADEIRKYGVDFYHGYPSALYLLAKEICNSGIIFPQPEAILLASEIVYDWQLAQIKMAFPKSKVFAHYGCAERTAMAGWCEYRQEYHVLPQYSLVEIDETTSEVIGTNFFNDVNGFVRYRMSDTVLEMNKASCPDCGRSYVPRFVHLGGRLEDYLYSPDNGWIPPAIVTYPLKSLKVIQEVQFLQKEINEILINYTVSPKTTGFLREELDRVAMGLHRVFGEGMVFCFNQVDDFLRDPSGKFRWIICELEKEMK